MRVRLTEAAHFTGGTTPTNGTAKHARSASSPIVLAVLQATTTSSGA